VSEIVCHLKDCASYNIKPLSGAVPKPDGFVSSEQLVSLLYVVGVVWLERPVSI
jgi:hypothetical protein